jgi:hypothetical protein
MKKLVLLLFIISATATACFSQNIQSFSMGGAFGFPTGQAKNVYDYSIGFAMKVELSTGVKPLRLVANLGYSDFVAKQGSQAVDANYLPIEVGAKLYLHQFYIEGDAGASVNLNSNYSGGRVGLIYAPGIGYAVPALDFDEVDFSIRYEGRTDNGGTVSQVVLKVAYKFNL